MREARVRVVSMPCMELFEAQSQEYRDRVLPPSVHGPRWRSSRGEHELVEVGGNRWRRGRHRPLRRFGAGTDVLKELGFTVENILARADALLESND